MNIEPFLLQTVFGVFPAQATPVDVSDIKVVDHTVFGSIFKLP